VAGIHCVAIGGVVRLGDRTALDVSVRCDGDRVVPPHVAPSAALFHQEGRGGGELQAGGRGDRDNVLRADYPALGQYADSGHQKTSTHDNGVLNAAFLYSNAHIEEEPFGRTQDYV
jgi:hypothetical protein